jgi:uncharacterized protein (DUF1684 family)
MAARGQIAPRRASHLRRSGDGLLAALVLLVSCQAVPPLAAQVPAPLARDRAEFADWLATAPLSPYAILALQPIGEGISVGYEPADIPLPIRSRGMARETPGGVSLIGDSLRLALPRGRPVRLDRFTLLATGASGRSVLAVYAAARGARAPEYFPYAASLVLTARLQPPERRGTFRTLGLDGAETEAIEAGFVPVTIGGTPTRLRVYRLGTEDRDEPELAIFFRDRTNGRETYPAGRFVVLEPLPGGEYRLDFNRARNPFCAYSSVYPCPAPWPGNQIGTTIPAGEKYPHAALEPTH